METYHKKTYAPLEPHELKKLKKGFYLIPIFALIMGAALYFMFGEMQADGFFYWFGIFFIVLFIGIFSWITWALIVDVQSGEKEIFQGVITQKRSVRHRSRKGGSKTSYYLYFGKYYEKVELHVYGKFQEGDMIEIHRAKRTYNVIFDMKLIQRGVMLEEINKMREEREGKARKNAWKVYVGFILAIPIFMSVMFFIIADCFDCGPEYRSSISEWKNVSPREGYNLDAVLEGKISAEQLAVEKIIMMMNDTLTDAEEGGISGIFQLQKAGDGLSSLILELDGLFPQQESDRSALQWLKYKFNEEQPRRYPLTFFELWKSTLRTIVGSNRATKRVHLRNEYDISNLNVLNDQYLSYEAVEAWYSHRDDESRQQTAIFFLKKDTSEFSTGLNQYMKASWSLPMALPTKDKASYEQGRMKYGVQ